MVSGNPFDYSDDADDDLVVSSNNTNPVFEEIQFDDFSAENETTKAISNVESKATTLKPKSDDSTTTTPKNHASSTLVASALTIVVALFISKF